MKDFKLFVVHHNNDTDGYVSGALAKNFFDLCVKPILEQHEINLIVEYHGYNYGKDASIDTWLIPFEGDVLKYDKIIFIDVTPPLIWFEIIEEEIKNNKVIVNIFDHHSYAYTDIFTRFKNLFEYGNFCYLYDDKNCGAKIFFDKIQLQEFLKLTIHNIFISLELQTKIFYSEVLIQVVTKIERMVVSMFPRLNEFVFLVDAYDTWKWKDEHNTNALAINEFVIQQDFKQHEKTLKYLSNLLLNIDNQRMDSMINEGFDIIEKKIENAKRQQHFIVEIFGEKVVIINEKANTYSLDYVKDFTIKAMHQELSGPNFDANVERYFNVKCILFYNNIDFNNKTINFSLRQIKEGFNCNEFAKKISNGNGGGHFAASGGSLSLTDFIELIKN